MTFINLNDLKEASAENTAKVLVKTDIKNKTKALFIGLLLMTLQGCAVYNSSFGCPDAKGLHCMTASEVDRQIDSGEIEEVELAGCKSRACRAARNKIRPQVGLPRTFEAKITPADKMDDNKPLITEEAVYVK